MIPSRILESLGRTLGAIVSIFAVTILISSTMRAAEPAAAANFRNLNNASLRLLDQSRKASATEKALLKTQAAALLKKRAAALQALIKSDPKRALTFAFSPELLAEFTKEFPASALALEQHGKWQGTVEYRIYDDFVKKTHRSEILLDVGGGQKLEVRFAGTQPKNLKSGDTLEVSGVQSGVLIAGSDGGVQATSLTAASCSVNGDQRIAVLMVNFPGVATPATVTPQSVNDIFFSTTGRSLDGFWREASYGQTSASGDVFGWYTLDRSYSCGEASLMRDAAIARAVADGANFQDYTRIFLIYPKVEGCFAGWAVVGCSTVDTPSGTISASTTYLIADYMTGDKGVQLATHEGGHNLGLLHSGTLGYGTEALGPLTSAGTVNEYGDYWSTMGGDNLGHYAADQKAEVLNWLSSGTNYQVVQSSGTWTLQPIEVTPAGLQALKIQRGTGNNAWLWVEFRQPIGNYDPTLMPAPFSGALIHYEDPSTGASTRLLDFSPDGSWNTWWSTALPAGQTWVDPYSNVSISVQSATSSGLQVNVNYSSAVCSRANPTISMSPADPSATPGNSVSYNVSVKNNDSASCGSSTFSMNSSQPTGWSAVFTNPSFTLSPGQTSSSTLMMTVPSGTAAGTYPVSSVAASSSSASAKANCTVVSSSALAVSVSVPRSVYSRRSSVSISAKATNGGATVSGAAVTFVLTKPNGITVTKKLSTDNSGTATWSYRISTKDPAGVYSVSASAASGSQTATSDTLSFSVQ